MYTAIHIHSAAATFSLEQLTTAASEQRVGECMRQGVYVYTRTGFFAPRSPLLAASLTSLCQLCTDHRLACCTLSTCRRYRIICAHHLPLPLPLPLLPPPPIAAKLVMDDVTPPPALAAPSSEACTASADAPDHASVAALRLKIFLILSDALGLPGPRSSEQDTDSTGQSVWRLSKPANGPRAATDGAQKGSLRQGWAVLC